MKYLSIYIMMIVLNDFNQRTHGTLTIYTNNFKNDRGKAVLFLFRKGDNIPSNPFKTISTKIKNREAIFEIQNLPFDDYAIIVLKDENDNGKVDHFMGFPSEQLGYSNNWELGFFTGMPTFSKLKFQFSETSAFQKICITYKAN